jgi:hypothetical protein
MFTLYLAVMMVVDYSRGYAIVLHGHKIPFRDPLLWRLARALVLLLEFIAVLQLFRLRTSAVRLFVAAWIARALLMLADVLHAVRGPRLAAVSSIALGVVAVSGCLVAYAFHLRKRGVLIESAPN